MIRRCIAALVFQASAAFAVGPHVAFVRVVPAPHDLSPAKSIAVIYAIGDNQKITTFVENFVEYVDRSRTLRVENAVEDNQHLAKFDGAAMKRLRHDHPADAYVGIGLFTCDGAERHAEGSEHDVDGGRVKRVHQWVDASCLARLDIRSDTGKRLFSLTAHGEGTSPRSTTSLSAEEKDVAYEQAARYAALSAAQMITPRMVRESIELDETAPSFAEGMSMIAADRLQDARAIWEVALRQHRDSAPLYYNLGAVCEALGDVEAAHRYLQSAVRLLPADRRYRQELQLLQRRNTLK
ncbi:MAG TPA: tetratricopeptide repeat protein [Thermoanaerobaculia bacterium]|jgi:tetratricopeptide (TPR) repeat protein